MKGPRVQKLRSWGRRVNRYWFMDSCSATPIFELLPRDRPLRIAEIGTRYGESAIMFNRLFDVETFYAIDPWMPYADYEGDGFMRVLRRDRNLFTKVARRLDVEFGRRLVLIRDFSSSAARRIRASTSYSLTATTPTTTSWTTYVCIGLNCAPEVS